jgi:hypothetical protein
MPYVNTKLKFRACEYTSKIMLVKMISKRKDQFWLVGGAIYSPIWLHSNDRILGMVVKKYRSHYFGYDRH